MKKSTYARFEKDDLTLRDALAVDRTIVANERTFLGYVRTTLAMLGAGAALLHFFDDSTSQMTGWGFIGVSIPLFMIGLWHYLSRRAALNPLVR